MESVAQSAAEVWRPDYTPGMITGAMNRAMCERLVAIAEKIGFERSRVYGVGNVPADAPEIRGSDSASIGTVEHREYYALVADIVRRYNAEHCRFAIGALDPIQVIRYRPGARFKQHSDIGAADTANRKVSVILQLSDPGAYEGGDLELTDGMIVSRAQGDGCVFPSWLVHEVHAVTSGIRYSLVAWAIGDYFR